MSPLSTSRASSRRIAPEPPAARSISSCWMNERSGWPKRSESTRCCVVVKSASAKPVVLCLAAVPILGMLLPSLGIRQGRRFGCVDARDDEVWRLAQEHRRNRQIEQAAMVGSDPSR